MAERHWLTIYYPTDGEPYPTNGEPYGTVCHCSIGADHDGAGNLTDEDGPEDED